MLRLALNKAVGAFPQGRQGLCLSASRIHRNPSTEAGESKIPVLEGMGHIFNDDGAEHRVPCVHGGVADAVPNNDLQHAHKRPGRRAQG
ncbi:hypothetical protein TSMEX_011015, partial [Taenia solium]